jgi:hypothetical protein
MFLAMHGQEAMSEKWKPLLKKSVPYLSAAACALMGGAAAVHIGYNGLSDPQTLKLGANLAWLATSLPQMGEHFNKLNTVASVGILAMGIAYQDVHAVSIGIAFTTGAGLSWLRDKQQQRGA